MCSNSYRHSRCREIGFTLIEVLAGLVLLGTLLAASTLAKARYTRQLVLADRRLEAVEAAERLLIGWWSDPQALPRSGNGAAPGGSDLAWQTRTSTLQTDPAMDVSVTRLEIYDQRAVPGSEPLVTVELVLPNPEAETRQPTPKPRGT